MYAITAESIRDAAKRVAAKHFFSGVTTQNDIDHVWSMYDAYEDGEDFVQLYDSNNDISVWEPFEHWDLGVVLENMEDLRVSVTMEINSELR